MIARIIGATLAGLAVLAAGPVARPLRAQSPDPARACSAAPSRATISPASVSDTIATAARRTTFDSVWQVVNDTHWDSTIVAGPWRTLRERYRERALATPHADSFFVVLNTMLAALGTSHFRVVPPRRGEASRGTSGTVGLDVRDVDGLVTLTRVTPSSPADSARLRAGFVLDAIDGQPVASLRATALAAPLPTVERAPASLTAVARALAGPVGSTVCVRYRDAADAAHDVALTRTAAQEEAFTVGGVRLMADYASRRLDPDGVRYVRFSKFVPALVPRLRADIGGRPVPRGLIVDLRGNAGGVDEVGVALAGLLVGDSVPLYVTRTRTSRDTTWIQPARSVYRGPVAVLVDEMSGSAAEQLAAGLQALGRATIVGARTEGADLDADIAPLPGGAALLYAYGVPMPPGGAPIEGRGVQPDVAVAVTRRALLAGEDPALAAALRVVRRVRKE